MTDVVILLGFSLSGAAIGFALVRGGLAVALAQLLLKSEQPEETMMYPAEAPKIDETLTESDFQETQEASVEPGTSSQSESDTMFPPPEEMASCPCGLVLPMGALLEHSQSTGHTGAISFAHVKTGKIWDLEQAIIEQTSPDCYKCGKPVKGLKRVGKTIYVSHLHCIDPAIKNRRTGLQNSDSGTNRTATKSNDAVGSAVSKRCLICWKPIRTRGSITAVSSTGSIIRFHNNCLTPDRPKLIP